MEMTARGMTELPVTEVYAGPDGYRRSGGTTCRALHMALTR
mgnify:CR=1 FL=1